MGKNCIESTARIGPIIPCGYIRYVCYRSNQLAVRMQITRRIVSHRFRPFDLPAPLIERTAQLLSDLSSSNNASSSRAKMHRTHSNHDDVHHASMLRCNTSERHWNRSSLPCSVRVHTLSSRFDIDVSHVPGTVQRRHVLLIDIESILTVLPRACTHAFPCGNARTPMRRNPLNRFNRHPVAIDHPGSSTGPGSRKPKRRT